MTKELKSLNKNNKIQNIATQKPGGFSPKNSENAIYFVKKNSDINFFFYL